MSRFSKLSHALWHCQYHIVWCPKYRYRVLRDPVRQSLHDCLTLFADQLECQIIELNIRPDHVHLIIEVPPKVSISRLMGTLKGRSAIGVFKQFPSLKHKPYWGNHFWARGYCVDTVGLDAEMIGKYVVYQERLERKREPVQGQLGF